MSRRPSPQPEADHVQSRAYDVFISYAHADNLDEGDHGPASRLAEMLEKAGYSVWWDKSLLEGQDWSKIIELKVRASRNVIALWSPRSMSSTWCKVEWVLARNAGKLIPFVLEDCAPSPDLAPILNSIQRRNLDLDVPGSFDRVKAALKGEPSGDPPRIIAAIDSGRVEIGKLPAGPLRLIGRDVELAMLEKAWRSGDDAQRPSEKTNVVVLHALGGAGKSALARRFVDILGDHKFPGAKKVYGWSAYSQGSGENKPTNPEGMIANALSFFGYSGELPRDRVDCARILVGLIRKQRSLIVLDGLEPLQSPPHVDKGRLRFDDLRCLVTELAAENPGLLILTSRQPLPELQGVSVPRVIDAPVDRLSRGAGTDLLQHLGVNGRQREIEAAVEEVQGHALLLNLLGTFLDAVEGGDVAKRDRFKLQQIIDSADEIARGDPTERLAKRARAIMDGYTARLQELEGKSAGSGAPEIAILSMVGLFDRPAERAALDVLQADPPINGLTDAFHGLSAASKRARWGFAIKRLRALKLLCELDSDAPDELDAHPVVRQHFGKMLRQANPEAFKQANARLFEHYQASAEEFPATIETMQPLFHAILHGCAAGQAFYAWRDVYSHRLNRGEAYFLTNTLGAYSSDLTSLAQFFGTPWDPETALLPEYEHRRLFDMTGRRLEAMGRVAEAVPLFEAAVIKCEADGRLGNASRIGGHLSESLLCLGRIQDATHWAEIAVRDAREDRSEEPHYSRNVMVTLSHLGEVHMTQGDTAKALTIFEEAIEQQENLSGQRRLLSIVGYRYAAALISAGRFAEATAVAKDSLKEEKTRTKRRRDYEGGDAAGWPLPRGLHALILCEAALNAVDLEEADRQSEKALVGLRAAGNGTFLPLGLLARARVKRMQYQVNGPSVALFSEASRLLDEALDVAGRGAMALHLADYHLESALLLHAASIAPKNTVTPVVLPRRSWLDRLLNREPLPAASSMKASPARTRSPSVLRTEAEEHVRNAGAIIQDTGYGLRTDALLRAMRLIVGA